MEQVLSGIGENSYQCGKQEKQNSQPVDWETVIKSLDMIESELQDQRTSAQVSQNFERWKNFMPFVNRQIRDAGLDDALPHFAAMIAKSFTGEVADGKGFCVQGFTGCGKTKRMELFARLLSVKFIRAEDMVERIRNNNSPTFLKEISRTDIYAFDLVPDRYYDLIIDDLGFESEKSNTYGNVRDIMEQVLKERSNIFPKWKTHFTTNLTEPQILSRYGDRIYSRLCEMCHFVTMTNADRRRASK